MTNERGREDRPLLAITMGDPSGIGPEIVLKALSDPALVERCRPLVVGDRQILERAMAWNGVPSLPIVPVGRPAAGAYEPGIVTLMAPQPVDPDACPVGRISAVSGGAAVAYVERACDLCLEGAAAAMVTAPIHKDAIHRAGSPYAGHTEMLAERTGAKRVTMLLTGPTLRVVHVSTHVPLAEAVRRVTPERVRAVIDLADAGCRALGIAHPRIAVAGLNPHAGEGGLFGDQEHNAIQPAVDVARAKGLNVSDPQPPDTVFLRASQGTYDIVVAMYHDQGHIPMKLLAFDEGVNVSLGLPIIRTSVDHGTAFDIAGTGRARETSLMAAIDVALTMVAAERSNGAEDARGGYRLSEGRG
jgi:4-phospho-D-threonate 3-dehydrogenase / 4-phospho-D-erythronate 3-dehydrogenase